MHTGIVRVLWICVMGAAPAEFEVAELCTAADHIGEGFGCQMAHAAEIERAQPGDALDEAMHACKRSVNSARGCLGKGRG